LGKGASKGIPENKEKVKRSFDFKSLPLKIGFNQFAQRAGNVTPSKRKKQLQNLKREKRGKWVEKTLHRFQEGVSRSWGT